MQQVVWIQRQVHRFGHLQQRRCTRVDAGCSSGRDVKVTGYVAVSESWLDSGGYPDVGPALLVSGLLVFPRGTARAR